MCGWKWLHREGISDGSGSGCVDRSGCIDRESLMEVAQGDHVWMEVAADLLLELVVQDKCGHGAGGAGGATATL